MIRIYFTGLLLSFQFVFLVIVIVHGRRISLLRFEDLAQVASEHCAVVIPLELSDERALSTLSSLFTRTFVEEPRVGFYNIDFQHTSNSLFMKSSRKESNFDAINFSTSFLLFKHSRKDRSCLLTPPQSSKNLKPEIFLFSGKDVDYNLNNVVDFINHHCKTFRNEDGSLTAQGQHESYIINNFFSLFKEKLDSYMEPQHFCANNDNLCKKNQSSDKKLEPIVSKEFGKRYSKSSVADTQCERISLPISKSKFLNEYVMKSKPVVIENGAAHWSVFKKWSNQFLREKYGDIKVHIKITPNGEYEGVESTHLWDNKSKGKIPKEVYEKLLFPDLVVVRPATMEIAFSEFISLIESIATSNNSSLSAYLEYSSISYFDSLEKDISEMSFIKGTLNLKHTNVWLSDGNTVGKLHFDPFDNFMCQISGEKEFILYEPHNNEMFYEAHIQEAVLSFNQSNQQFSRHKLMESTSMVMSPVDIEKPNFERFPKFAAARPMSCSISPGDVLFTPSFWWHEVRSTPNATEHRNLALNFWYEPFLLKEFPCQECRLYVNPKYFDLL